MKTIEERAKEYADRHKATEINYFGVGKVYGYERTYNAEITAYERGATEQKAIDEANYQQGYHDATKKACDLLKAVGVLTDDDSIMGFIKAMEE